MTHRPLVNARIVIAAAALAAAGSAANAQTLNFRGTDPMSGHSYYTSDVPVSFNTGRALASNLAVTLGVPAYLAAINSAPEQQYIIDLLTTADVHWIGFTAEAAPGTNVFAWDSGEPVLYTNWSGGAPVLGDPLRNYASINWTAEGGWLNLNENGAPFGFKFALVEVVPAPSAAAALGLGALLAARRRRC